MRETGERREREGGREGGREEKIGEENRGKDGVELTRSTPMMAGISTNASRPPALLMAALTSCLSLAFVIYSFPVMVCMRSSGSKMPS